jgi:uncharacterized damage-inducible protein DinB
MTEATAPDPAELEDILRRLEQARESLVAALNELNAEHFPAETGEGESIKRVLERTVDDLNLYYGRLAARALNLPQPPCLQRAEFSSLREATMALQVAHRRFSGLLHDLIPEDLEKVANDPEHGTYTLRQILELTAAQYNLRAQQVKRISEQVSSPS